MTRLLLLLALGCAAPQVLAQEPAAPAAPSVAADENALKYLQAARAAYKPYERSRELSIDEARRAVAENAAVFPLLDRALQVPLRYGERDFDGDAENDVATPLFAFVRNAARLLEQRSRVQAADGDLDGAVDSCLRAVALGLKMQEDGPMIAALDGQIAEVMGRRALVKRAPQLSVAQLKAAARRLLEAGRGRRAFGAVLASERAISLRVMGRMLTQAHGGIPGFGADRRKAAMEAMSAATEAEDALLSRPFALARGIDFSAPAEEADETEDADEAGGAGEDENAEAERPVGRFDAETWAQSMVRFQRPNKGSSLLAHADSQAQLSLLATALAARAYQIENKAAPASLQVLVPKYLPAVPLDPFTLNEPLRLKAGANTVTIYSVGPDGLDDDGLAVAKGRITFDTLGDIPAPAEVLKF